MVAWLTALGVLAVFAARLLQSTLFTIADIMRARGRRKEASLVAFAETTVWFVAFTVVLGDILSGPFGLLSVIKVALFLGGWGVGTYLGLIIEESMGKGYVTLQVISLKEKEMKDALLAKNLPFTVIEGMGRKGPRSIYQIIIRRKELHKLLSYIDEVDPEAFVNILETRAVMRGKRET